MEESHSKVIIDFEGVVSFHTISSILPKLKERLELMGEKVNTYKRLLTITIELLENSYRYINSKFILESYQTDYPSYLRIMKQDNNYLVESGNTILREDVDALTAKLDLVNSLDESGLRELYKQTISNGQFSAVGGAGLGFIEISKASGEKLAFNFDKIEQDIYYYKLKLDVKP
jgi:hypothetical protein